MKLLIKNITNMYGEKGEAWIANLPDIISSLASYWELKQITPVDNMTFNYVAKAMTCSGQSVVLKISYDEKSILNEVRALKYFDGNGSIQFISYHAADHALLLQQAVPGVTLKSLYSARTEYVMDCYVAVMRKLHSKRLSDKNTYHHIKDWLSAIDRLSEHDCPAHLIKKAITLKNKLLTSMTHEVFLHGDLHHDNILQNADHWLAIDPKGVVGEPEFEMAAFDFMYVKELADHRDVKDVFEKRVELLAQKAGLNSRRIKDWVFVRLILMVAWQVEDNGDPSWAIKLADSIAF